MVDGQHPLELGEGAGDAVGLRRVNRLASPAGSVTIIRPPSAHLTKRHTPRAFAAAYVKAWKYLRHDSSHEP